MTNKWKDLREDEEGRFYSELDCLSKALRASACKFSEVLKKVPPKERRMEKLIEALDCLHVVEIRLIDEALGMVEEALIKFVKKTPSPSKHPFGRHVPGKQSAELATAMGHFIESCGDFYVKSGEIAQKYDPTFVQDEISFDMDRLKEK